MKHMEPIACPTSQVLLEQIRRRPRTLAGFLQFGASSWPEEIQLARAKWFWSEFRGYCAKCKAPLFEDECDICTGRSGDDDGDT